METLEWVHREGRERLHPRLTNPSWLVLGRRREIFKDWIARLEGHNLEVLDLGGRIQPYRPLFESRLARYVAIDLRPGPLVDIVASGEQIPVADETFDLVICTQVLEYVPDPAAVIAEIYRVLKPRGWVMLSVPAVFPRDSDQDAWRFLPRSLKLLLGSFRESEVLPEGSSVTGFFRTICICITTFARPAFIRRLLQYTVVPALNLLAVSSEFLAPQSSDRFAANFSAAARK